MSPAEEELPSLDLVSTCPRQRTDALWRLLDAPDQGESELARVAELVADADTGVRAAAAGVFEQLGARAAAAVENVAKLLGSAEVGVVAAAASVLGYIGSASAAHVEALEALLDCRDEDSSSRALSKAGVASKAPAVLRKPACAGVAALASVSEANVKVAAKVGDCLLSRDSELRAVALLALGNMGREGAKYEQKALECLQDPSPLVVVAACEALGCMAVNTSPSDLAASGMADLLGDANPRIRAAAAKGIRFMGDETYHHLDALLLLLRDASPAVRAQAARAIGSCGEVGQMHALDVSHLCKDRSPAVRIAACDVLAQMGPRGACFEYEVSVLAYDEWEVSEAATRALDAFAKPTEELEADAACPASGTPRAIEEGVPADAAPAPDVPAGAGLPADWPLATSPVALMFPGQGSQNKGMLGQVKDKPAVREMLAKANSILGWDVLDLCLKGPEDKLEQTKYCQPVMYVGGLAAVELLRADTPEVVDKVRAVAGLSLGEYTALAFAGVFDFETGLKLVKLRGEAMQEAAERSPQAMASVAGLERSVVEGLCTECAGTDGVCQIANFLFPKGFSCSGSKVEVEQMVAKAEKAGALQAKLLKTSGAFHTSLMEPAKHKLEKALKEHLPAMRPPTCDVYMNTTGKRIPRGTDPADIVPLLADQLCNEVLWEPVVRSMIEAGLRDFYECGPNKQLTAMMKRIDSHVHKSTKTITV